MWSTISPTRHGREGAKWPAEWPAAVGSCRNSSEGSRCCSHMDRRVHSITAFLCPQAGLLMPTALAVLTDLTVPGISSCIYTGCLMSLGVGKVGVKHRAKL